MDSSCLPAGFTYLGAYGLGIALIVLSAWLVLLMRAVYREDGGFRRALVNAAPLWVLVPAGVGLLYNSGNSLLGWADRCLPTAWWSTAGGSFIGIGLFLALTAVGRLIFGRIRARTTRESIEVGAETSLQQSPRGEATAEERPPNLPPERRRVIVEYVLTYGAAVLVILVGVGFA